MIQRQASANAGIWERAMADDIQVIRRPRCPQCESVNIEVRSSRRQGDGSLLRYCRCRDCGQSLKVVVE
ncbi:MAG: hypothetical protein JXQ75_12780 [Phycisphaerae bacterium]|nr:hypothetical protein [Phycisphaerae bacterium]